MKTPLLSILFFLLISVSLLSCGNLKEPDFQGIENVKLSRLGLQQSNLLLNLLYFNPNNSGMKLKRAEGDAWVDDNYLGHFTVDTLIHIAPVSDFRLPVNLHVDMNFLLKNGVAAFLGKDVTVKLDGKARLGKGIIFINYPIRYEGKQKVADFLK